MMHLSKIIPVGLSFYGKKEHDLKAKAFKYYDRGADGISTASNDCLAAEHSL